MPSDVVFDAELSGLLKAEWPDLTSPAGLANTAAGRLILLQRPDLLERLARAGIPQATPHSPTTARQLDAILRQIGDLGASVESEHNALGWRCVAVRVDGPGRSAGIFGVTVPAARGDLARIVRAALRVAEGMTPMTGPEIS
jgi:DNA-binding IclR family transcriptional regulator